MNLLEELTEEWRKDAACRGVGPDFFFLDRGRHLDYSKARELCGSCPVRTECLNFALRCEPVVMGHRLGFWAGMLPDERRALAAKLGRLLTCSECGEPFASRCNTAKVCSIACRRTRNNRLDRLHRMQAMSA